MLKHNLVVINILTVYTFGYIGQYILDTVTTVKSGTVSYISMLSFCIIIRTYGIKK